MCCDKVNLSDSSVKLDKYNLKLQSGASIMEFGLVKNDFYLSFLQAFFFLSCTVLNNEDRNGNIES